MVFLWNICGHDMWEQVCKIFFKLVHWYRCGGPNKNTQKLKTETVQIYFCFKHPSKFLKYVLKDPFYSLINSFNAFHEPSLLSIEPSVPSIEFSVFSNEPSVFWPYLGQNFWPPSGPPGSSFAGFLIHIRSFARSEVEQFLPEKRKVTRYSDQIWRNYNKHALTKTTDQLSLHSKVLVSEETNFIKVLKFFF